MEGFKLLSRSTVLDLGRFLRVETHEIELPDKTVIPDWPWIITPDYVNVVAVTAEGEYLCFCQTKYAIEGTSLAPVGGYIDPGEEPAQAARRELLEETGFAGGEWLGLGAYRVDSNRGAGTAHLYLARGVRRVAEPDNDDLEEQELVRLRRAEMEAALDEGRFRILPWAMAVALALRH